VILELILLMISVDKYKLVKLLIVQLPLLYSLFIFILFSEDFPVTQTIQHRIKGNDELQRMWKEVVVA